MKRILYLLAFSSCITASIYAQNIPQTDSLVTDSVEAFRKQDLREVQVVGRKRMIEQKIDKTVVNVDASATNAGTNALQVLEKSPGIQVDKDGNISLKGKTGVTILVDGRPTYLSGQQLAAVLKGMESSQLEQIEIMTNPPAKYDAAGNSGVINIKTKKNKSEGFNGSISAGYTQWVYAKTNENLSLNYKKGKFNIFTNYSYSNGRYFHTLDIHRRFINDAKDTRAIFDQQSTRSSRDVNNNLKAGLDYYLSDKTTLGLVFTGFTNPSSDLGLNTSYLKNAGGVVDSIVKSIATNDNHWNNGGFNLNLRHKFDSTGRELDVDLDAIGYHVTSSQLLNNISYDPSLIKKSEDFLYGDLPMDIRIYSAKADYTHPLKKDAKIEAGWKSSYVTNDSKAKYFNRIDGKDQPDYSKTNFFLYKENINAAYFNYNKKISPKWSVQGGLRFENTNNSGLQHGNPTRADSAFSNTYNGLFPTAYISYTADKDNQFALSGGRRIDRPNYADLNPFLFFIDRYTYGAGNPYLRPQYSNNVELSHVFKGVLTTTLNYSYTKNLFTSVFNQSGDYATVQSNGNIGHQENVGISVSSQLSAGKWLNTNIFANYSYMMLSGVLYGDPIKVNASTFNGNINNQVTLNHGWGLEVSGWYNSRMFRTQMILYPMGAVSTGVTKQFLKGKGTVKLDMRDIFFTQPANGSINFKTTEATFHETWESRAVNITLTYRFGKPLNLPQKKQNSPEEKNRVR